MPKKISNRRNNCWRIIYALLFCLSLGSTTQRPSWSTTRTTTTTTPKSTTFAWTSSKATTHSPITTEEPDQLPGKNCQHGQYYSYPNSCSSFLICVNGNLVSQQCGPGLNWNKEKGMCDWAFKAPCVKKPVKSAALTASNGKSNVRLQQLSLVFREKCFTACYLYFQACTANNYSGVPGDCESFQACLWGRFEVFRCAPGLHFNARTRICDWPARANCKEDSDSSEEQDIIPSVKPPINNPPASTTQKPWEPSTTQATTTLPSAVVDPDKVSPLTGHYKVKSASLFV